MNKNRCYICYESINPNEQYHSRCVKKLFKSETVPELAFASIHISSMALEYIKEKRGLPGVQKKLSLTLESSKKNEKRWNRLTVVGYHGGEYILKPPTPEYPQMPEIEDLTMHLAEIAKIAVPPHGLIKMKDGNVAYIIKRFDRQGKQKIAVEDLCQLSLKLTQDKYKSSYESIGKIIRKYSSNPGDDCLKFFELVLFSFIVGNADMHLKNFSLITQDLNNIILAPGYDLLSTKLLIPESMDPEQLALPLNGKKLNLRKKDFIALAQNLKIPEKVVNYSIKSLLSNQTKWEAKINTSFLNADLQNKFKQLIVKNIEQIH